METKKMEKFIQQNPALAEFHQIIPLLDTLADERRQQIMILLIANEQGLTVRELTNKMDLSQPAISHHLKQLKDLNLVASKKQGTSNVYKITIKQALDQVQHLINTLRNDDMIQ